MEEITKLQNVLKTGWFRPQPEVTENTHIRIDDRLTLTPESAQEINEEIRLIEINSLLGVQPSALQLIALKLLKNSY